MQLVSELKAVIFCPFCGSDNAGRAKYCRSCGKSVKIERQTDCRKCGAELRKEAKFCSRCGVENETN